MKHIKNYTAFNESMSFDEAFAINELLDLGYTEDDIVILNSDIESYTGKIWYDDSVGTRRKYYPDIIRDGIARYKFRVLDI